ncbi:MAG TPA: sensor histidine kinase, partial [Pyrinomonadaceae bacterium]|nr:sensor histidine kinase [Pyrinomonadaceae bacterium]
KYRVNRLLQIERTRTQIAADLHDDIGSNLSKISLMSELARLKIDAENEENQKLLASVAEIARDSVGSMRDIIWAINPHRDSLLEVSRKMRSHAEETLVPLGIELKFDAPQDEINLKFAPELRRELYLIFKESVNNCAKHANASRVEIEFSVKKTDIFFKIADNGKGFDPNAEFDGEGINGMKRRAAKIGGNLNIESAEGNGTRINLSIVKNARRVLPA